jgi:hypothetical protein
LTAEGGHVYRYEGGAQWTDMGRLGKARNVLSMASYKGGLYAGAAFDDRGGERPVGTVYRLDEATGRWIFSGQVGAGMRTECMVVCNGELYAGTVFAPGTDGVYRYRGGETWEGCGDGHGGSIVALGTYHGALLATPTSDRVFRLASPGVWEDLGGMEGTLQTWGLAAFQGRLVCSDYPPGCARSFDESRGSWSSFGRIAEPAPRAPAGYLNGAEAMFLANYNGKLYGAVWPTAEVARYDGGECWTSMGILGKVGDGRSLRYEWVDDPPGGYWKCELADEVLPSYPHCYPGGAGVSRPSGATVYRGKLFVGVWDWEYELKSHVYALEAGKCVTADRPLPDGWRHLAAVKQGGRLRLYVDGQPQGESIAFYPGNYVLANTENLKIGFGEHSYFRGRICDVRLYNRGLPEADVQTLAKARQ